MCAVFYRLCARLVCILAAAGIRHRANLPPATFRATSKQLWPSDLQAIYEIWIIPHWGGRKKKKVSGDFTPCVRSMWRLSGLETEMIAYGMAQEWDAITGVICACCLLLSPARVWMLQHSAYVCVHALMLRVRLTCTRLSARFTRAFSDRPRSFKGLPLIRT